MIHRKPPPRAPSNHTALVSLPNINDIVSPATQATSLPSISKRKFLNLYSSTAKKIRVSDDLVVAKPSKERTVSVGKNVRKDLRPVLTNEEGRSLGQTDDTSHREGLGSSLGSSLGQIDYARSGERFGGNLQPTVGPVDDARNGEVSHFEQDWSMPNDTKIALELMRAQFPKIEKVSVRPFVLRSQIHSSVNDRTLVNRELERLKLERVVRIFKLNTGQDDYAIMFMTDYLAQIDVAKVRLVKKHSAEDMAVFDWFVNHVLPCHADAGITHLNFVELLSEGGDVKDRHISLLMNAGLVTRQLVDSTAYWLAIPNVGFLLKSLTSGRREIVSFLSRRKYREMMQSSLERRRLQYSVLGIRFHLRDLLGLGQIHAVPSPSGPIIRLNRD